MATTFVDVLLQLRNELGADVLAGGKIETYEAGTTTPLATYQDLAGNTANTNPVVLDSSGMAVIRQTDGVAYKWVVSDSDDNELWTRDNITVGVSSSSSADDFLVNLTFEGTPGAQGFMGACNFDREVVFPIDFEGAVGSVQTAPAATYTISIRKADVEVGTAVIATSGTFTFATTSHVAVTYTTGSKLTFIAPDSVGTAADFGITLVGAVS